VIPAGFVFLGAALSLVGSLRYAQLTIRGRTRPNRVTWVLWAAAPLIGFAAQLDGGVGLPAVLTLSIGLGPAIIVAASFVNPAAYWRISRFDLGCGAVSVLALVVWLTVPDPAPAVVVAMLADLVAGIPTIRKVWTSPETEAPAPFAFAGTNGVVALLTLDRWAVEDWVFPVYIVVLGYGVSLLLLTRTRRARRVAGAASGGQNPSSPRA